mmetsp:Transcript_94924/g.274493  ORF Transcript_94924/g.274493 Transcript_94924/m.274493 type:complete len:310 (+) Transcript_94924:95-1024(+)
MGQRDPHFTLMCDYGKPSARRGGHPPSLATEELSNPNGAARLGLGRCGRDLLVGVAGRDLLAHLARPALHDRSGQLLLQYPDAPRSDQAVHPSGAVTARRQRIDAVGPRRGPAAGRGDQNVEAPVHSHEPHDCTDTSAIRLESDDQHHLLPRHPVDVHEMQLCWVGPPLRGVRKAAAAASATSRHRSSAAIRATVEVSREVFAEAPLLRAPIVPYIFLATNALRVLPPRRLVDTRAHLARHSDNLWRRLRSFSTNAAAARATSGLRCAAEIRIVGVACGKALEGVVVSATKAPTVNPTCRLIMTLHGAG